MTNQIKRPWQGTTLAIISMFLLLSSAVLVVMGLDFILKSFIIVQKREIAVVYLATHRQIMITAYFAMVIGTIIIMGYFNGRKGALIIGLIGNILNVLTVIIGFIKSVRSFGFKGGAFFTVFLGVILWFFLMWLQVQCLKHPFYGGNGRLGWDTLKFWKKRRSDETTTF